MASEGLLRPWRAGLRPVPLGSAVLAWAARGLLIRGVLVAAAAAAAAAAGLVSTAIAALLRNVNIHPPHNSTHGEICAIKGKCSPLVKHNNNNQPINQH